MKSFIKYFSFAMLFATVSCGEEEAVEVQKTEFTVSADLKTLPADGGVQVFAVKANRGWVTQKDNASWLRFLSEAMGKGDADVELEINENKTPSARMSKVTFSCGEMTQEFEVEQFGTEPQILLDESAVQFSCNDTIYEINVHSNVPVSVTSSEKWMKCEELPYTTTTSTYVIAVTKNMTEAREATLTFAAEGAESQVMTIKQAAFKSEIHVTAPLLPVSGLKEEVKFAFNTNDNWTIEWEGDAPDWATLSTTSGAEGTHEITIALKPNDTSFDRTHKLVVVAGSARQELELVHQTGASFREQDSLVLAEFYHAMFVKPEGWDLNKPMTTWGGSVIVREGRVMELSVGFCGFTEVPASISKLSELRVFQMIASRYENVTLPASFNELTKLNKLTISGFGSVTLPDFAGMTALRELSLVGVVQDLAVTNFEAIVDLTRLQSLTVEKEVNITALPESFENLTELEWLAFRGTQLASLPEIFLPELRYFTVSNSQLKGRIPTSYFAEGGVIQVFDLANNQLTGPIPVEVFQLETVEDVNLSDNELTGNVPVELASSNVRAISLARNNLGGINVKLPSEVLKDSRWHSSWFGSTNICPQNAGPYGFSNCQ